MFYVSRLQLDPCPYLVVLWQKKRVFLVAVLKNCELNSAVWQIFGPLKNMKLHYIILIYILHIIAPILSL